MSRGIEQFSGFGAPLTGSEGHADRLSPETIEFTGVLDRKFNALCSDHGVNPWFTDKAGSTLSLVTEENELDTSIALPPTLSGLVGKIYGEGAKVRRINVHRDKLAGSIEKFYSDFDIDLSNTTSNVLPGYSSGKRAETFLPDGSIVAVNDRLHFDLFKGTYELMFTPADTSVIDGIRGRLIPFQMTPELREEFKSVFEILDRRDGTRLEVNRRIRGLSTIHENG